MARCIADDRTYLRVERSLLQTTLSCVPRRPPRASVSEIDASVSVSISFSAANNCAFRSLRTAHASPLPFPRRDPAAPRSCSSPPPYEKALGPRLRYDVTCVSLASVAVFTSMNCFIIRFLIVRASRMRVKETTRFSRSFVRSTFRALDICAELRGRFIPSSSALSKRRFGTLPVRAAISRGAGG